ncbi:MAG: type II secretion system major pseudopilin GspG [Planctomycetes bacterium]|nr:type II secretion system major pseudopilin GspG [Planctomycetota bacterium]
MTISRKRRRGFTLIEVLMVVAILVLLAGVTIVAVSGTGEKTKIKLVRPLLAQVSDALERYKLDIGSYPTEEEGGLKALRVRPEYSDEKLTDKWAGPYLKSDPIDPWGNPISYQLTEPGTDEAQQVPFKLWSFGPNKQDDNGAEDDIRNKAWEEAEQTQ